MVQLRNGKILVDTLDLSNDLSNLIMTEEEKKDSHFSWVRPFWQPIQRRAPQS